jgi:hypothetical protein
VRLGCVFHDRYPGPGENLRGRRYCCRVTPQRQRYRGYGAGRELAGHVLGIEPEAAFGDVGDDGVAPVVKMGNAVGRGAVAGTITSVPGRAPSTCKIACSAEDPELTAIACAAPNRAASAAS